MSRPVVGPNSIDQRLQCGRCAVTHFITGVFRRRKRSDKQLRGTGNDWEWNFFVNFSAGARLLRKADLNGSALLQKWGGQRLRRAWFIHGIGDLDTKTYLSSPQSDFLRNEMVGRYVDEVAVVRQHLKGIASSSRKIPRRRLKIALSNHALEKRSGTELWIGDVAAFLVGHGAEVIIYSPVLGDVASSIAASTRVPVTSSVADVQDFAPDILHLQHYPAVRSLVSALRSSRTAILNMCHGLLPRLERPQPDAGNYCAVSLVTKSMVCLLTNAEWQSVPVLPNFFDAARYSGGSFGQREPRALLFSRRATPDQVNALRRDLAAAGLTLDIAGLNGEVERPEDFLPTYRVVLAVGRSAVEALASGCQVVLWDQGIVGPAVTASNFWQCVTLNFALPSGLLPYRLIEQAQIAAWLTAQLDAAALDGPDRVYDATRKYLALDNVGLRLHQIYSEIADRQDMSTH